MLQLLQQRTKLSGQIGEIKRRHGAVIYVPERERELLARLTASSKGVPSARAVAAIYREILSSSRAAQGQAPIGLLAADAERVLSRGRLNFGACDKFICEKKWPALARRLDNGELSLVLLTGAELLDVLSSARWRAQFLERFTVVGDYGHELSPSPLARRIFSLTPGRRGAAMEVDQMLILIECKSTVNAIKSLLNSMRDLSIQAEHQPGRTATSGRGTIPALVRLSLARPMAGALVTSRILEASQLAGLPVSILGIYPGTENYGG